MVKSKKKSKLTRNQKILLVASIILLLGGIIALIIYFATHSSKHGPHPRSGPHPKSGPHPRSGPISPGPISPGPISPGPISPGPISPGPISPGPISPGSGPGITTFNMPWGPTFGVPSYLMSIASITSTGSYAIIDFHDDFVGLASFSRVGFVKVKGKIPIPTPQQFGQYWAKMAEAVIKYVPNHHLVMFELFNEPIEPVGYLNSGPISPTKIGISSTAWQLDAKTPTIPTDPTKSSLSKGTYYDYQWYAINAIRKVENGSDPHIIIVTTYNNWSGLHSMASANSGPGDGTLLPVFALIDYWSNPKKPTLKKGTSKASNLLIAAHQYINTKFSGLNSGCGAFSGAVTPTTWVINLENYIKSLGRNSGDIGFILTEGNYALKKGEDGTGKTCPPPKDAKRPACGETAPPPGVPPCNKACGTSNSDCIKQWHYFLGSLKTSSMFVGFTVWNAGYGAWGNESNHGYAPLPISYNDKDACDHWSSGWIQESKSPSSPQSPSILSHISKEFTQKVWSPSTMGSYQGGNNDILKPTSTGLAATGINLIGYGQGNSFSLNCSLSNGCDGVDPDPQYRGYCPANLNGSQVCSNFKNHLGPPPAKNSSLGWPYSFMPYSSWIYYQDSTTTTVCGNGIKNSNPGPLINYWTQQQKANIFRCPISPGRAFYCDGSGFNNCIQDYTDYTKISLTPIVGGHGTKSRDTTIGIVFKIPTGAAPGSGPAPSCVSIDQNKLCSKQCGSSCRQIKPIPARGCALQQNCTDVPTGREGQFCKCPP